jgi:hypothetical protein
MKKIIYFWVVVLTCALLTFVACQNSVDDDSNPGNNDPGNEDPIGNIPPDDNLPDPNELTASLGFPNANLISGQIPSATGNAEFKIDIDTLFWVEGIKKRIRIRYPEMFSGAISSILIQVKNADKYFELEPEETESTDTIAVFYFDFDPEDWEPPLSFNLDIAVKDETGVIVDYFPQRPVEIEKPGDFGCSPVGDRWDWLYTVVDGVLNRAEGYPQSTPGTVKGCCVEGTSYYGNCIDTPSEGVVDYEAFYLQDFEYVKFFKEGNLAGELHEIMRNVNPTTSDFCSNRAGYNDRTVHNIFTGNYSFNQQTGKITLSNMDGLYETVTIGSTVYEVPLQLYFGNFGNVEMISCHFLVDRSNVEGMGMERVFERRSQEFRWYD